MKKKVENCKPGTVARLIQGSYGVEGEILLVGYDAGTDEMNSITFEVNDDKQWYPEPEIIFAITI